jgi:hypothetical protein
MQINLFKIIFYALVLVEILASDALLKTNESGILELEPGSSLNSQTQCEERDDGLYSVSDETLEIANNIVPNNLQSIPTSDFEEPPLPQVFNNQNQEQNENDNFLSGMTTERVVDHLIGRDRRHPCGSFLRSFIFCDVPLPFSTDDSGWGRPTLREYTAVCISFSIFLFMILFSILVFCGHHCLVSR